MNYNRLESRILADEGFRANPYLDSVGRPTIGYGTTRLLGGPVTLTTPPISEPDARQYARSDIFVALLTARALFPRLENMNHVRQEVLVNMAYNLGQTRLAGFKRLRAAIQRLDYQAAADEMHDSRWFHQVGKRSSRLVRQMRTGKTTETEN